MRRRHSLSRRRFLKHAGIALPVSFLLRAPLRAQAGGGKARVPDRELAADIVIIETIGSPHRPAHPIIAWPDPRGLPLR